MAVAGRDRRDREDRGDIGRHRNLRRLLRAAVGAFFVFAAMAKAADFDGFLEKATYYRAVPYVWMVRSAWATIVVEGIVGIALVTGLWGRVATVAAAVLLIAFSLLVAHAWHAYGITDCACLGSLVETPPWLGIAKNAGMLAVLWLARPRRKRAVPGMPDAARSAAA